MFLIQWKWGHQLRGQCSQPKERWRWLKGGWKSGEIVGFGTLSWVNRICWWFGWWWNLRESKKLRMHLRFCEWGLYKIRATGQQHQAPGARIWVGSRWNLDKIHPGPQVTCTLGIPSWLPIKREQSTLDYITVFQNAIYVLHRLVGLF